MKKEIIRNIVILVLIICIIIAIAFCINYYADFFKSYNYNTVETNMGELDNAEINVDNLSIKLLDSSEEETNMMSPIATIMFNTLNDNEIQELTFAYLVYDNNKNILAERSNKTFLPKYFVKKEYNSLDLSKYNCQYSGTTVELNETKYIEAGDKVYNILTKINEDYKGKIEYPIHIQLFELQYKDVDTSYNSKNIKYTNDVFEFILNK